jgi:hypothetical protein
MYKKYFYACFCSLPVCSEFAEMPLGAPLDLLCYENKLSVVFALVGVVITLLPGNGPYCFWIYGNE